MQQHFQMKYCQIAKTSISLLSVRGENSIVALAAYMQSKDKKILNQLSHLLTEMRMDQ